MSGLGVEFDQFDAAPIRSERHPQPASRIKSYSGVNRVEVIRGEGTDDDASVGPFEFRIGRIERGVGREADGGSILAPTGNRKIKQVATAGLDDVRRPEIIPMRRSV